ncbi:MAG: nucleoside-diphosphate kinase [Deltaproteobacteria bacterium]|nr:nucleoside-diphosphate kinase [Deltaproteobacteria bacterium]
MARQRTLAIIKPDAMKQNKAGAIIARLQEAGFEIKALRQVELTRKQAEGFYDVHRGKSFFMPLCEFMSSAPVIVMVLEADNAIDRYREVIGATDPARADKDTIRRLYGTNVGENAVHGSDARETAAREIAYFFPGCEVAAAV